MNTEILSRLNGPKKQQWQQLLRLSGLEADEAWEQTVLVWEEDRLIAAGSRQENLLKCLAVDPAHQGEGLLATVLTALRQEAFAQGHRHLFLYTKPQNEYLFRGLMFYPVAQTDKVLLMEDRKDGIRQFLDSLPCVSHAPVVGAAVMNCDPFTLGHQYLIQTAAAECDRFLVFVLSEDKGHFAAAHRLEMVKRGTAHLPNVTVLPTGPYLISAATFPTYFLKEREQAGQIQCRLDIEIFCKYFAPKFGISRRYVGTEPLSPMTSQYNQALAACLPEKGIALHQVPRLEVNGGPVSASTVRKTLNEPSVAQLLPATTLDYLKQQNLIK